MKKTRVKVLDIEGNTKILVKSEGRMIKIQDAMVDCLRKGDTAQFDIHFNSIKDLKEQMVNISQENLQNILKIFVETGDLSRFINIFDILSPGSFNPLMKAGSLVGNLLRSQNENGFNPKVFTFFMMIFMNNDMDHCLDVVYNTWNGHLKPDIVKSIETLFEAEKIRRK